MYWAQRGKVLSLISNVCSELKTRLWWPDCFLFVNDFKALISSDRIF